MLERLQWQKKVRASSLYSQDLRERVIMTHKTGEYTQKAVTDMDRISAKTV